MEVSPTKPPRDSVIVMETSMSVSNSSSSLVHLQKVARLLSVFAHISLGQTNLNTMHLDCFVAKDSQQASSVNLKHVSSTGWHSTIMECFLSFQLK